MSIPATINLTPAEIQSGHDRVRWAEDLILQLPEDHDGRNSWLLNYGEGEEALRRQVTRGLRASPPPVAGPPSPPSVRKEYRLSDSDFARLIEASKSVLYLVANGSEPTSPRDAAMRVWREIAAREGFDVESVKQVPGKGDGFYTAISAAALTLTETPGDE